MIPARRVLLSRRPDVEPTIGCESDPAGLYQDLKWDRYLHHGGMSTRFKAADRETPYLLPPWVQDWLPEQHLARFIVEVVSKLDLHELKMPYTGVGSEAFNPEMLLAMLFYGYATGVFSVGSWNKRRTIRLHSGMSRPTRIPITIRSRRFGSDS